MNIQEPINPGVYINEANAFPNSVTPVPTAIPAFIGYTPQASYQGRSFTNVPQKISSFAEFQAIYMLPDPLPPAAPVQQYSPQFYWTALSGTPSQGTYQCINGQYYSLQPDPSTIHYLYNSVRLFFENGGTNAYILSVGGYGPASGQPSQEGERLVNPHVQFADLQQGLALLQNVPDISLYCCPDAPLLSADDYAAFTQAMLQQASSLQSVVCLLDVPYPNTVNVANYMDAITDFRNQTGTAGLDYGAAYYPYVQTTLLQSGDLDYGNLFGGQIAPLVAMLNPSGSPDPALTTVLQQIANDPSGTTRTAHHNALLAASPVYAAMMRQVLDRANLLPPSGAIAGIITQVDDSAGPWQSPANVAVAGVKDLPIALTDAQQAPLNSDLLTGKSINAIRFFSGLGILVWGARTLDGNSLDWRHLSVRRTLIYLEQTCKLAAKAYVFEPNDANTWMSVKSMISSFLTSVWKQGGLQGASAADAFSVDCGLGTTMTAEDILNGFMRVTIKVAVVRPAEFLVITFEQQMAS